MKTPNAGEWGLRLLALALALLIYHTLKTDRTEFRLMNNEGSQTQRR